MGVMDHSGKGVRLDKWLWAARFFKTRSLAADEIAKGRVSVNGQVAKAAREPRVGDRIEVRQGAMRRVIEVLGISASRGPAPVAQLLYAETAESLAERELAAQARRAEPALDIERGRPTKRDRRGLDRTQTQWQRWSASIDDD